MVGQDVIILQGVTLGGTGKESGDRHPKIGNGVILHPGMYGIIFCTLVICDK